MTNETNIKKIESISNIVNYVYQFELFNKKLDDSEFDENLSNQEKNFILKLIKHYGKMVSINRKFLRKDWAWTRLQPLVRAILVVGAFELINREKGTVINGMIIIAKAFIPDDKSYKLINAILDKVGNYYATIKKH